MSVNSLFEIIPAEVKINILLPNLDSLTKKLLHCTLIGSLDELTELSYDQVTDIFKYDINLYEYMIQYINYDLITQLTFCAMHGNLELLKSIASTLHTLHDVNGTLVWETAIKHGKINILKWMCSRKLRINFCIENDFYKNYCQLAAENNQFKTLTYIYDKYGYKLTSHTLKKAIEIGNLEMVAWLCANMGCNYVSQEYMITAIFSGHLTIVRFLSTLVPLTNKLYKLAVRGGHLDIVKYLKEISCPVSHNICDVAARYGKLTILQFLVENGCQLSSKTFDKAVKYGKIEMLDWLEQNKCHTSQKLSYYAIKYNKLNVLQWLFDKDYAINRELYILAIEKRNLEIFKWFLDNILNWENSMRYILVSNGALKIYQWAEKAGHIA